jgi:hypothetical protein
MKTRVNDLVTRFDSVYKGIVWYGDSMIDVLTSMEPLDAIRKNVVVDKSAIEILYHMVMWRQYAIAMLDDNPEYDIEWNSELDWKFFDNPTERLEKIPKTTPRIPKRLNRYSPRTK